MKPCWPSVSKKLCFPYVKVVKTSGPITFDGCGQLSISVAHLKDISMLIILRLEDTCMTMSWPEKENCKKWLHSPLIKPINAILHQSTVPADCYVPRHLKQYTNTCENLLISAAFYNMTGVSITIIPTVLNQFILTCNFLCISSNSFTLECSLLMDSPSS